MSLNLEPQDSLEELRQRRDELKDLDNHPGFKRLTAALEAQLLGHRIAAFNSPVKSMDSAFDSAYRSGEIAGIQLGLSLRKLLIENLSADIMNILDAERNENGESD